MGSKVSLSLLSGQHRRQRTDDLIRLSKDDQASKPPRGAEIGQLSLGRVVTVETVTLLPAFSDDRAGGSVAMLR